MTKKVAIIGAGPAGFAAAHVLNLHGFEVDLYERSDLLGGKVHSFSKDGRSYEHGVHGWWMNYKNFDQLLADHHIEQSAIFQKAKGTTLLLPDGRRQELKLLDINWPSPFFLFIQMLKSPLFKLKDVFSLYKFGILLFSFKHEKDYAYFDYYSFQELMDNCGVSKRLQAYMFEPFILSFDFTTSRRVSASCGLSGLQFYVLRDQQSILARWLRATPEECIFSPLKEALSKKGVRFHLNAKVNKLSISNNKVQALVIDETEKPHKEQSTQTDTFRLRKEFVPVNNFFYIKEKNVFVGKWNGAYTLLSARCTHQGCTIRWKEEQNEFECPCHGGRFGVDGRMISGPPPHPLKTLHFNEQVDDLVITESIRTVPAENVIIATDVIAARDIFRSSLDALHPLNAQLARLDGTPVMVIRLWFKGENKEPDIESALTPEFTFIDNFFNLNSFNKEYGIQGHIIEVQSYRVFDYIDKSDEVILKVVFHDLQKINTAYQQPDLTFYTIYRHRNLFTRYGPALYQYRPSSNSSIDNVFLAGDWTGADYSVWMMERAVVSGIRAANEVLQMHGLAPHPIIALGKETIALRLTRMICRLLRKFILPSTLPKPVERGMVSPREKALTNVYSKKDPSTGLYFKKPTSMSWYDWVVLLLHTGAEIEHALMNQYLFTGYSINLQTGSPYFELCTSWKKVIVEIAIEEMGHFVSIQHILQRIGAPLNMDREDFPLRSEFYPFPFELNPFSKKTIGKYLIAEMPSTDDPEIMKVMEDVGQTTKLDFINRVGCLYEDLITIFKDTSKISDRFFASPKVPIANAPADRWQTHTNVLIKDVKSRSDIISVLEEIAEQGEGNADNADAHFHRFLTIYREVDTVDKSFRSQLAYRIPNNPTASQIPEDNKGRSITHPISLLWNDLFNLNYRQILCALQHLLSLQVVCYSKDDCENAKNELTQLSLILMRGQKDNPLGGLRSIAEKIFTLPLREKGISNINAAPTFEIPYTLNFPANEDARWNSHIYLAEQKLVLIAEIERLENTSPLSAAIKKHNKNIIEQCSKQLNKILVVI